MEGPSWAELGQNNMRPLGTVPDDHSNATNGWVSWGDHMQQGRCPWGPFFTESGAHGLCEGR